MSERSCLGEFCRYTFFSVLGTLGVSCYILADTFFISMGLGTDGLAALNLAIPVYNFIHGAGLMLGMGGGTRFSFCRSQGRVKEGNRIYTNTLYLAVLFSAVFAGIGMAGSKTLAVFFGAKGAVLEMTDMYLKWVLLFAPAFIFNDVLLCFVRNDDAPQLSMFAMLAASFANIVLDYMFIFPLGGGIFGAAFATGLSPVIGIAMLLPHWIRRKNTFRFNPGEKMQKSITSGVLSLGIPSLIGQVCAGIVMIVLNGVILYLEGNTGVAAYGVVANLALVSTGLYTGIEQGAQPLFGRFYGIGDQEKIRTLLRYAMAAVGIISAAVYVLIFVFAKEAASAFNSGHDAALQKLAVQGLRLYFLSAPFAGFNIVLVRYFVSVEKAMPAHLISLLRGFLLIIPAAFLMAALWGMTGVWLACPAAELLTALWGGAVYLREHTADR